jgi:hypothetical protein
MPHFQLVTTDGDVLGAVELGRPDWPEGSIIYRGDRPNLRVVGRLDAENTEHEFAVLAVEEA